jgi:hypothetical protein
MNDRQRRVLGAGFLAVLVMGLFPPWKVYQTGSGVPFLWNCGYGFVLAPPAPPAPLPADTRPEIHTGLLLAQVMCAAGATGLGVLVARSGARPREEVPPRSGP